MRRYPQWLDGAFIKLACELPNISRLPLLKQTEGLIKLHALFGTELIISDIQLIDSPVLMKLFTNESYINFLNNNKRFMTLVARPEKIVSSESFSIASSGFQRASKTGWISSTFEDPESTKAMANAVLDEGEIDLEKQLKDRKSAFNKIVNKWPDRKPLLEGMLRGVSHFSSRENAISELSSPDVKTTNLYEVLYETLQIKDLPNEAIRQIKRTIKWIDDNIEGEDERGRQSIIFNKLDIAFPQKMKHDQYNILKGTVHHAWSAAVEKTLKPDGDSLGYLYNGSIQVGEYLAKPTDTLLPITKEKGGLVIDSFRRHIPVLFMDWDPTGLPWNEICRITTETRLSAQIFQNALLSGEETKIHDASVKHIKEMTRLLVTKPAPFIPHSVWLLGHVLLLVIGRVLEPFGIHMGPIPHEVLVSSEITEGAIRSIPTIINKRIMTGTFKDIAGKMKENRG